MKTPAGQHFDVFSAEELATITTALERLKDRPNQGTEQAYAYTNGFGPGDLIYPFFKKIVLERLQTVLGRELHLTTGMYLKESQPWGIHTDYVKGDAVPDLAVLIPLDTQGLDTHTVVFNEQCKDTFDQFIQDNQPLAVGAQDLLQNLMSHETANRLQHVSLQGTYAWRQGSVIFWDRRLLHASDNFLTAGITEKRALVLFTHQP
jgi:hypothetical protein